MRNLTVIAEIDAAKKRFEVAFSPDGEIVRAEKSLLGEGDCESHSIQYSEYVNENVLALCFGTDGKLRQLRRVNLLAIRNNKHYSVSSFEEWRDIETIDI